MSVHASALVWRHSEVSGTALVVALAIADWADDWGRAYPSVKTLAVKARCGERAVQYALTELAGHGELLVLRAAGPHGVNVYQLLLEVLLAKGVQNLQGCTAVRDGVNADAPNTSEIHQKKKESASARLKATFDFDAGAFGGLDGAMLERWAAAYPAVDVPTEIKRSAVWLTANPKNKKSDYVRFINGWLSRAQDRAPRAGALQNGAPAYGNQHDQRAAFNARIIGRQHGEHATGEVIEQP